MLLTNRRFTSTFDHLISNHLTQGKLTKIYTLFAFCFVFSFHQYLYIGHCCLQSKNGFKMSNCSHVLIPFLLLKNPSVSCSLEKVCAWTTVSQVEHFVVGFYSQSYRSSQFSVFLCGGDVK